VLYRLIIQLHFHHLLYVFFPVCRVLLCYRPHLLLDTLVDLFVGKLLLVLLIESDFNEVFGVFTSAKVEMLGTDLESNLAQHTDHLDARIILQCQFYYVFFLV